MSNIQQFVDTASISTRADWTEPTDQLAVQALIFWHLLSLDAPTVAALWTWFIASANHVRLPATAILAMFLAVWLLYAADRLLDSRSSNAPTRHSELEPRHYFHRRHQTAFRAGIAAASVALAFLLPRLEPQSIRLYLILGSLLAGYFVFIHAESISPAAKIHRLPKEIAVGIFFSAAIFIPTVARQPLLRLYLLPGALLFAILCSLNCLFIFRWEHDPGAAQSNPEILAKSHLLTQRALHILPLLVWSVVVIGLAASIAGRPSSRPVFAACGLSAILLLLLHRSRHLFTPTTLRAAADVCLLTPILLLPLLHN